MDLKTVCTRLEIMTYTCLKWSSERMTICKKIQLSSCSNPDTYILYIISQSVSFNHRYLLAD